jgi:hypothetical protein
MSKVKNEITDFGFNFGAMKVTRTCSDYKGGAVVSIKTDKGSISIRSSKTGVITVYDNKGVKFNLNQAN